MEGLSRVTAAGLDLPPVRVPVLGPDRQPLTGPDGGPVTEVKVYHMSAFTLDDFGRVEQHLLRTRKTQSELAVKACKELAEAGQPALAQQVMLAAIKEDQSQSMFGRIPTSEVQKYLDSSEGLWHTCKMLFEKKHPGITNAEIKTIFEQIGDRDLMDWRDRVTGADPLGNSTGSESSTGSNADPETEKGPGPESLGTGEKSSGTSPKPTGGPPDRSAS